MLTLWVKRGSFFFSILTPLEYYYIHMVVTPKYTYFFSYDSHITQKSLVSCNFETAESLEDISLTVMLTPAKLQPMPSLRPWEWAPFPKWGGSLLFRSVQPTALRCCAKRKKCKGAQATCPWRLTSTSLIFCARGPPCLLWGGPGLFQWGLVDGAPSWSCTAYCRAWPGSSWRSELWLSCSQWLPHGNGG